MAVAERIRFRRCWLAPLSQPAADAAADWRQVRLAV
jgi:hypothetical protein